MTDGSGHSPEFPGIVDRTDGVTDNDTVNAEGETTCVGVSTGAKVPGPFPAVSSVCLREGYVDAVGERVPGIVGGGNEGIYDVGMCGHFVFGVTCPISNTGMIGGQCSHWRGSLGRTGCQICISILLLTYPVGQ